MFAGADVSLNVFDNSTSTRRWQLQVYGVVIGYTPEQVRTALSGLYPAGKRTPRPLKVNRCNKLAAALSYPIKPYFGRRVSYLYSPQRAPSDPKSAAEELGNPGTGRLDRSISACRPVFAARLSSETGQAHRHRPGRQSRIARVPMTANYVREAEMPSLEVMRVYWVAAAIRDVVE